MVYEKIKPQSTVLGITELKLCVYVTRRVVGESNLCKSIVTVALDYSTSTPQRETSREFIV
jgi:hypothetical protein